MGAGAGGGLVAHAAKAAVSATDAAILPQEGDMVFMVQILRLTGRVPASKDETQRLPNVGILALRRADENNASVECAR